MSGSDRTPPRGTGAQLPDVLQDALRKLVADGRERLVRAAGEGRAALDLRAAQRERDALWLRLGKEAYHLHEAGELDHPAIARAKVLLDDVEDRIRVLERELTRAEGDAGDR